MRHLIPNESRITSFGIIVLAMYIALVLAFAVPARAFEVISVPGDVNAINLSAAIDVVPGNGEIGRAHV